MALIIVVSGDEGNPEPHAVTGGDPPSRMEAYPRATPPQARPGWRWTAIESAGHAHETRRHRFCPRCAAALDERRVEHRLRPVCPACGFIWYDDPKVAACTLPVVDGRLILVRRAIQPERGKWVFPGGYMDRGETVEQAAVRETSEETGLHVAVRGLSGVYSYVDSIVVVVVFRVAVLGGTAAPGPECLEVRGFSPAEIPWPELGFASTADALRDWLEHESAG